MFQPILQAEEPFEVSKHPYDTLENHNEKYKKKVNDIGKVLESGPTVMVAVGYPGKLSNHRLWVIVKLYLGSGKSTFGQKLTEKFGAVVCCRDDLG